MTDPLDDLKTAMDRATPAPDPAVKRAALAQAAEAFDAAQDRGRDTRPTSGRPRIGAALMTGAGRMLRPLATRGALVATTATAAVALFLVLPRTEPGGPERAPLLDAGAPPAVTGDTATARREAAAGADADEAAPPVRAEPAAPEALVRAPRPAPALEGLATADRPAAAPSTAPAIRSTEDPAPRLERPDTEAFANADPNPVRVTAEDPVSTVSADVDTASYAVIRSSLIAGRLPPAGAVRIEEMINYFPYDHPAPGPDGPPFRPTVTVTETPWNPDTRLLEIALQGRLPAVADRPALNLVFLVDSSGSMQDADKLPLLKQSVRLMLSELRPEDEVAIVTYAGQAGRVLEPTPASDRTAILAALDRLEAGGSTAGAAGLDLAYATADGMAAEGEVTRVLLATDGDFNVGISDPERLEAEIARKRAGGTYLSVLGFGRGNLDDATMQALAQAGNGTAAYIDTLAEARKVLVDQLTGALFPIADDVKLQVEFNPAAVAEYRLIGYETRALRRADFANDRVDAGEIGAGHAMTALYEIVPVGSPARLTEPLRYAADEARAEEGPQEPDEELAFLRLRYKAPGEDESRLIELPITPGMGAADDDTRFAAAIAGFGQLLTQSPYLGDWGWDEAIRLAEGATGADRFGYRREAVTLMRLAQSLSD